MSNQKPKRKKRHDTLVLNLLIIVTVVLVVFEGRLVVTLFTHHSSQNSTTVTDGSTAATNQDGTLVEASNNTSGNATPAQTGNSGLDSALAGLTSGSAGSNTGTAPAVTQPRQDTVSNPDSPAIVPQNDTPVDDSYFADAAFIGDSRMEGFHNASGITQGTFFTSVGMSLSSMKSEAVIATADGTITVAAALSGGKYNKIYIMLGANDLGEYDWDSFRDGFISCTSRFQEIQPDAIFYVCSVIYVEEAKVTTGSYVNNANVDKINSILLDICEEQGYHYLDLNEFLSNGYGSLIDGASSDGVHIYENYCKQMLDYLKCHYIPVDTSKAKSDKDAEEETEETETEASASA